MNRKGLSELEAELLERIQKRNDPEAKELFFARYEDLLHSFAHKYRSDRLPYEDAYQLAALGLMKAVRRFDPSRGISFITFAYPTVEGELKKHYRDHLEIIRLPRPLRDLRQRITSAASFLWEESGQEPDLEALAEYLGVADEEIIEALAAQQNTRVFSLDSSRGEEGDGAPLSFFIGSHDPAYEEVERDVVVNKALRRLPPRHRSVMELRLKGGWTQVMIARELGVSQMHISRLIREAVEMMQDMCSPCEKTA
ncbi:MAG: sigma-70 family RNA polymerase sigma factor [Actinomycetota bacterium]